MGVRDVDRRQLLVRGLDLFGHRLRVRERELGVDQHRLLLAGDERGGDQETLRRRREHLQRQLGLRRLRRRRGLGRCCGCLRGWSGFCAAATSGERSDHEGKSRYDEPTSVHMHPPAK
jgi:hypothetical protein